MSIIYDAIQKIQRNREQTGPHAFVQTAYQKPVQKPWLKMGLLASLAVVVIFNLLPSSKMNTKQMTALLNKQAVKQKQVQVLNNKQFVLNGLLLGKEKVAVINNKIYHINDTVHDMTIARIEKEGVTLQRDDQNMLLTA